MIAVDIFLATSGIGALALSVSWSAARAAVANAAVALQGAKRGAVTRAWLTVLVIVCYSGWYRATLLPSGINAGGDRSYAKEGLALRSATTPDAVVAAHAIGAMAYFSHRQVVDLLGKVDPVIAHMRPRTAFWPGHDRWDYHYSSASTGRIWCSPR